MAPYATPKLIEGVPCSEVRYQMQRLRIAGFSAEPTTFHSHIAVRRRGHLHGSLPVLEGEFLADAEVTAIVHQSGR